jgi:hypothetical protein
MPRITRRKLLSQRAQTTAAGGAAFAAAPILATRAVGKELTGRAVMSEARHLAVEASLPTQSSLQAPACLTSRASECQSVPEHGSYRASEPAKRCSADWRPVPDNERD